MYCKERINELYITKLNSNTGEPEISAIDGSKMGNLAGSGTNYDFVFIEQEGHNIIINYGTNNVEFKGEYKLHLKVLLQNYLEVFND